jgi:monothiol glutaredoxin
LAALWFAADDAPWRRHTNVQIEGIKEYSEWPTIPQLYVDKEFIGGCDILMTMHQDGSLAKMLEEKGVVVPAEPGSEQKP